MNYLQEIPNSKSITNKNNVAVTTQVFLLSANRRRIFLPLILKDIIGFKVKSICWSTAPAEFAASTMLFLSCDDLIEDTINQSMIILPDPAYPNSQTAYPTSIIATWILDKLPAVISTNSQVPNFEQPTMWLRRPLSMSQITFRLGVNAATDVTFDETNLIFLTLEFYYYIKTSDEK